jgi:hypothetical protein
MAFCTNCGNQSDTNFCPHCGTNNNTEKPLPGTNSSAIVSPDENVNSVPISEAPGKKNNLQLILVIGMPAAVIVIVLAFLLFGPKTSPFPAALEACVIFDDEYIYVADDGNTLLMDGEGEETWGASSSDIWCVLDELNVPDSVVAKMEGTNSLQGVVSDSWDGIEAEWTYHPDDGFDVVLTLE